MNANALKESRMGIMLHYSVGDVASTVSWCKSPKSGVSYNSVIGPDGAVALIVPYNLRAWHAGACKPSTTALPYTDANSAFEGIALAGGPTFGPVTAAQELALCELLYDRFAARGWDRRQTWRIVGHDTEAWPRGRKVDPTGDDPANPWLDLARIRGVVGNM